MVIRKRNPVNYDLCSQTVTLYRKAGETIIRTVYRKAFFEWKKLQSIEKTGSREATSFLLVIPGNVQACYPGDKVILGEGPEIGTMPQWRDFIPAKVAGMAVVDAVDVKYWNGEIVHTEATG